VLLVELEITGSYFDDERNGIWSRTGLRPASELDSVVEFGFNLTIIGAVTCVPLITDKISTYQS